MATGFKRPGLECAKCGEAFALGLAAVKNFQSVEKLPDPFQAKCPDCEEEASYPKSAIRTLAAVGRR